MGYFNNFQLVQFSGERSELRNQKIEFSRISGTALFVVRPALSTPEPSGVQTGSSGKAEADPEESRYSLIPTLRH